jgi:hypothetical protein
VTAADDIIEGTFRIVATGDAPRRPSPNRRRAALRIAFWRSALLVFVVLVPLTD